MTDTEIKRRRAICEVAHVKEIDDVSDGFHTFRQLYYQRMMLFATIVKQNKDKAWKSLRHEDGELCFGGGWFVVGIDTPEGSYTYHYENKYFDLFDCEILDYAKHWDGHTEKDVTRLLSLEQEPKTGHWIPVTERLPEDNKTVIASVEYGVYPEAKYTKEYGWEWAYEAGTEYWVKLEKVRAWMPLPKPYVPQESEVQDADND